MGMGLILPSLPGRDEVDKRVVPYRIGAAVDCFQETAPALETVPETDTGGLVENTEALERTVLKELGKLPP
jgi:hypothetical protein